MDESLPLDTAPAPKRGVHWIFVGSEGLRAGWGVLLFVLLYIGFLLLIGSLLQPFLRQARHVTVLPVRLALIIEVAQFLPTILATAVLARIERRSAAGVRISRPGKDRALSIRLGLGIYCPFRIRTGFVEGPPAGF